MRFYINTAVKVRSKKQISKFIKISVISLVLSVVGVVLGFKAEAPLVQPVQASTAQDNIIISEVGYETSGTESGSEWVELYNPTGETISLDQWRIEDIGGTAHSVAFPTGITVSPGQYLLIVNVTSDFQAIAAFSAITPDVELNTGSGGLRLVNGGDELRLLDDTGSVVDYVAWEGTWNGVDWTSVSESSSNGGVDHSICRTSAIDSDLPSDWSSDCAATPKAEPATGALDRAPIAADDSAQVYKNFHTMAVKNYVDVDVLSNDTDADGDTMLVTQINGINVLPGDGQQIDIVDSYAIVRGKATLLANGEIRVTPNDGDTTPMPFTYTVADPAGLHDEGAVLVTIRHHRVSGTVWYDENGNGVQDATETSILQNVNLRLFYDANNNMVMDASETLEASGSSDALGHFNLDLIDPGDYVLTVVTDTASLNNDPVNGNLTFGATTPVAIAVSIPVDGDIANQDFGFDDAKVSLSVDNALINEPNGSAVVTATVTPVTGFDTVVDLSFAGVAQMGVDYDVSSSSIPIFHDSATGGIVINVIDDALLESNESLNISIASIINATEDGTQQLAMTVGDDEIDTDGDGIPDISDTDDDGDNIPDVVENLAPAGDGNGDGIQDSLQSDVATVENSVTGAFTTLAITGGTCEAVVDYSIEAEADLSQTDSTHDYPLGLNRFTLACPHNGGDTATVTIYYDKVYDTSAMEYWKNYTDGSFGNLSDIANIGTATVNGVAVSTVTFTLTDGDARTDADGAGNGEIVDPSGLATATLAQTGSDLRAAYYFAFAVLIAAIGVAMSMRLSQRKFQSAEHA